MSATLTDTAETDRHPLKRFTLESCPNRAHHGPGLATSYWFMHNSCMSFKTITVDIEAYELLRSRKRPGESFSQVIKSGLKRGGTGRDLARAIARQVPSEETLENIESLVAARRKSPARPPKL